MWGFRVRPHSTAQHSQREQTSGREDGTEPVLMGEKLAAPWMSPSTFHFVNAVLSVTPVNKAPVPREKKEKKKKKKKRKARFICGCT